MKVFLVFRLHVPSNKNKLRKEPFTSSPVWVHHKTRSFPSSTGCCSVAQIITAACLSTRESVEEGISQQEEWEGICCPFKLLLELAHLYLYFCTSISCLGKEYKDNLLEKLEGTGRAMSLPFFF